MLDALDIRTGLNDGDLVADAVVILRIVTTEGRSDVRTTWSAGMDWVTRRGLIEVARDADRIPPQEETE
ncbi:hypothetical protein [Actinotalea sp.]|uniref:hypothetical protein n=1 Tax=Actinotalea sp. TaxID=1872145 RepID=UPI003569D598